METTTSQARRQQSMIKPSTTKQSMCKTPHTLQTVYLIPAPDMKERAIEAILAAGIKGATLIRVELPPIACDFSRENLQTICDAIKSQIHNKNPILLGFCYGGALAIEVARELDSPRVILVSSLLSSDELPVSRKLLAKFFLRAPESGLSLIGNSVIFVVKKVLRRAVKIPRIWKKIPQNRFISHHALNLKPIPSEQIIGRIHGERDAILPIGLISNAKVIKNAGHFLFVSHRKEMLRMLGRIIERNSESDALS
jgi:hypothetical protein